jgi:predicted metal-dependent enzyme (double-stranded beta helix superfamily)
MFDLDRFVASCRTALTEDAGGHRAVRELLTRTVAEPGGVLAGLGEPQRAGITALHRSADLTILNVVWAPRMTIMPHDHRMWAVIGVYTGGEDNIFWRRLPTGRVEAAGAQSLRARDCAVLGRDIVHSVTNPLPRLTGAIHIYGGDFFAAERSEWDPETLSEGRYDVEKARRMFEDSNGR